MVGVSAYLNFDACAEQALLFYADVFGTEVAGPLTRMGALSDGARRRSG